MASNNKNSMIIIAVLAVIVIAVGAIFVISPKLEKGASNTTEQSANDMAAAAGDERNADNKADDGATEQAQADQEQSGENQPGTFNGVEVEPGNPVVATVDGRDITRVDVYRYIQAMPANVQQLPASQVYPLALQQVINTRLIQNMAEDADLENDPEVQQQLDMAQQQIIRNVYIQRKVDEKITDDKLQKEYKEYVKELPKVEERKARHILVDSESKAEELISELEDGAKFEELAKENSIGPTAPEGGELGWFAKEDMVPEFAEVAFNMDKGKYTKVPVQTQFGWHVILIEDVRNRPAPSFEEMKPMLQVQLRREILEDMLADWKDNAEIEQFDINGDPIEPAAGGNSDQNPESN